MQPKKLMWDILLLLHRTESTDFPVPAVSPISGGGIQLDWFMGKRDLEVEFVEGEKAEYLGTDMRTGESLAGEFAPSDFNFMRTLLAWVQEP